MPAISAVLITKNEERNIARCLGSLAPVVDEIIVVDSGSTDSTEAICHRFGAIFTPHTWEGYSQQKNFANSLVSHPLTLSIDADEALSPALAQSILQLKNQPLLNAAYRLNRLTNFCGHWIHHCGWYPDAKVRLWPSGSAHWQGDIHEELILDSPFPVQPLQGDLLHYSYYSVNDLALRQPGYYRLAASEAYAKGRRSSLAAILFKPLWTFFHDYILRLGFLDGRAGYIVCRMNAHYTFMKYTTLLELSKQKQ